MGIKICTCADIHIGVTTYGTIDANTGLNTRILNCLNSIDKMIDYCIDNKIEYMIIAGDTYKNNLPSPTLQKELNSRIKRAASNNIAVYIMDGNHDVSPISTAKSALEPFKTLDVNNVYHSRFEKEYIIDKKLRLLMMPTYCNQKDMEEILDKYNDSIPTIVVAHATILGAMLNDWLLEQNENAIDSKIFEKNNILAVVLGHLHKHQILKSIPLVYYTGSLQRIDFTEEFQQKGFTILDVDIENKSVDYEFIEIESQKFFTLKYNLKNSTDEMEQILNLLSENKPSIKNSIFRLDIDVNKGNNINDEILLKNIKELDVQHIASIQKNIDRVDSVRNKEITESLTEEKALEMYFKDHENKNKIVEFGLNMISKLKSNNVL